MKDYICDNETSSIMTYENKVNDNWWIQAVDNRYFYKDVKTPVLSNENDENLAETGCDRQ